jgi:hypothetical protein
MKRIAVVLVALFVTAFVVFTVLENGATVDVRVIDGGAPASFESTRNGETPLGAAVEASSQDAIAYLESIGAREW